MQYLDLTLFVDHRPGFSAIAYLETMKANGVLPKKIICLAFTRARRVQQLSYVFGQSIAHRIFDQYLKRQQKKMFKFLSEIEYDIQQSVGYHIQFLKKINLKEYTQTVETIYLDSYKDKNFLNYIQEEECKTFLYASSGIVPADLLNIHGIKIIHIHPGIVPEVKGSDGLFYSYLLKGKLGYSVFYMNSGIDTGDIILQKEWEFPKLYFRKYYNDTHLYKAILAFIDSYYRAQILLILLQKNTQNLEALSCIKQDMQEGKTYFTMHPKLRSCIVRRMVQI